MNDSTNSTEASATKTTRPQFSIQRLLEMVAYVAIVFGVLEWSERSSNPIILAASGPIATSLWVLLRKPQVFGLGVLISVIVSGVTFAAFPAYIALTSVLDAGPEPIWVPTILNTGYLAICGVYLGAIGGILTELAWLFLFAILWLLWHGDERA